MRCLICNKDIDGDFERCPECGSLLEQQSAFTSVLPVISEEDERKKFLEAIDAMEDDEVDLDDLPSLNNLVTDLKDDSDKKIGGVPFDTSEITKITDLDKTIEIEPIDTNLSDNEAEYDYNGVEVKDEYEVTNPFLDDMDKTVQFKPTVTSEDDLSLTGLINKQIEDMNNGNEIKPYVADEPVSDIDLTSDPEEVQEEYVFDSDDSIKQRKRTLITAFVIMIVIICGCFTALYIMDNKKSNENVVYNSSNTESFFNNFINSNNDKELKKLLMDIRNNREELEKTQKEMYKLIEDKLEELNTNEYSSIVSFNNDSNKYKELLSDIYAITETNGEGTIRLLNNGDYQKLIDKLDTSCNNAKPYFEALDLLNEKSYNEAYVLFSKIEEDNNYYYKAQSYLSIVVDDVLILIKNDVIKIESGIEELSDDDKLIRYSQIEDVIIAYSSLYEALDLNNNEDYTNLLNTYKEKVNSLS